MKDDWLVVFGTIAILFCITVILLGGCCRGQAIILDNPYSSINLERKDYERRQTEANETIREKLFYNP